MKTIATTVDRLPESGPMRTTRPHPQRVATTTRGFVREPIRRFRTRTYRTALPRRLPIWRFTLLSLLLHALLVLLPAMDKTQTPAWPAPELNVSLRGISVARSAPAATTVATANRSESSVPLRTDPSPVQTVRSLTPGTRPGDTGRDDDRPGQEQRLTNHLLSLLRAELQTHFVYPPLARRQGWQGRVQVTIHIEADGRLSELQVMRSSGYSVLDADAVHTLQRIGQLPQARAWLSGRSRRVEIPVVYRLLEG